jgi:hypothetical protein
MGLPRPTRIIFAALAVACGVLTGGVFLTLPQATSNPTILPTPPRLTLAPAASGASFSTPVATPAVTPAEPPPTPTPPGGILPLPAPPAAPDALADDTVVKLRELAEADPAAVAEAALSEPSRLRERMLLEALPVWAERDPVAAAKWLGQQNPAREFDLGVSAVAHHPAMLALPPSMALGWASDIVDDSLRITAQRSVVQQWSQRDARQIRTALEQARELAPKERALLLSELDDLLAAR